MFYRGILTCEAQNSSQNFFLIWAQKIPILDDNDNIFDDNFKLIKYAGSIFSYNR